MQWTLPEGQPRGAVVVAHGVHQHAAMYKPLAARLADAGFAVLGFDFTGFGHRRSGGPMVDDFEIFVEDLAAAVDFAQTHAPVFVFGHSLGGLVATLLARRSPAVRGWVLSSPSVSLAPILSYVGPVLGCLPASLVVASYDLDTAASNVAFIRDFEEQDAALVNPGRPFEAGYVAGAVRAIAAARASVHFATPLLILHGAADDAHDHGGCAFLAAAVKGSDLRVYPEYKHELVFESGSFGPGENVVVDDIVTWLLAKAEASRAEV